jgi:hypothetical protein
MPARLFTWRKPVSPTKYLDRRSFRRLNDSPNQPILCNAPELFVRVYSALLITHAGVAYSNLFKRKRYVLCFSGNHDGASCGSCPRLQVTFSLLSFLSPPPHPQPHPQPHPHPVGEPSISARGWEESLPACGAGGQTQVRVLSREKVKPPGNGALSRHEHRRRALATFHLAFSLFCCPATALFNLLERDNAISAFQRLDCPAICAP